MAPGNWRCQMGNKPPEQELEWRHCPIANCLRAATVSAQKREGGVVVGETFMIPKPAHTGHTTPQAKSHGAEMLSGAAPIWTRKWIQIQPAMGR